MSTWLDALKVGDEVLLDGRTWKKIAKIAHITPTRRFTIGSYKFDSRGRRIGEHDPWSGVSLLEATPERRADIVRANRIDRIARFAWSMLTDDELAGIDAIIETAKARSLADAEIK